MNDLQQERNRNAKSMKGRLEQAERDRLIAQGKAIKERLAAMEQELSALEGDMLEAGRQIPNLTHPGAPSCGRAQKYKSGGG